MLRLTLTAIAFLISIITIHAQDTFWTKTHPIIEKALNVKNAQFTTQQDGVEGILDLHTSEFKTWGVRIVKSPEKTFALINGTGRVYEIKEQKGDSILVARIDNTGFFGYNFQSINFTYKGKLYSFGGNGFWRRNGQLKVFSEIKKEWDIVPINFEIPTYNQLYVFDYFQGKLYYSARSFLDPGTNKRVDLDEWYALDLNTLTNTKLGKISEEILSKIPEDPFNIKFKSFPLPEFEGAIISDKNFYHKFIHFPTQKIYTINNEKLIQTLKGRSTHINEIIFSVDSTLYISLTEGNTLDSIQVGKVFYDISSGKSILKNEIAQTPYLIIIGFTVLGLIALTAFYRKRKKSVTTIIDSEETPNISYEPIEESLIELLKNNLDNGVTIPEVNDLLGLTRKPLSIQKKNRNEVIQHINTKFKLISGSEEDLIIRKRDENDKRSFIYFLNQEVEVNV